MGNDQKKTDDIQNLDQTGQVKAAGKADEPESKQETDFKVSGEDWANRTLCRDESCIGVIGPDGHCKECGLEYGPGWSAAQVGDDTESEPSPEKDEETAAEATPAEDEADINESDPDDEWAKRTLCRDESCIGVIGPDGRCKECGLPYKE